MDGLRGNMKPTKSNFTKSIETKKRMSDALRASSNAGEIQGPGTGTSDDVPINASDGEFILPEDTVQAVGADNLNGLIQETHQPTGQGGLRNFADGGEVKKDEEEKDQSTFDKAISGQLGLSGTAKAVGGSALEGIRNFGGGVQRATETIDQGIKDFGGFVNDVVDPAAAPVQEAPSPVESSAAALESDTALETNSDPVPGSGIRRIDAQGQSPTFTNLTDQEIERQPEGNLSFLNNVAQQRDGGSAALNAARNAALDRGDTKSLRRELNLAQGGLTAETQRLDDLEAQNALTNGDSFRDGRRKRQVLRQIALRRHDLSGRQETEADTQASLGVADMNIRGDLALQGLRNRGDLDIAQARAGGRQPGGQPGGAGSSGDKALNSFRDTLLNTLPPTEGGEPDVETANAITASTRAAVTQQAKLLREAGRSEDADRLEREGVGSFSETQKQGLVIGTKVRDRFLDKSGDFFVSGTRGIDSGNPADFVPVGIDPNDPERVLLSGDGLSIRLKDLERVKVTNTLGIFPGFFGSPARTTSLLQGIR